MQSSAKPSIFSVNGDFVGIFTSLDDYGCRRDDKNHKRLYISNMKTNKLKQFDVEFNIESLELVKKNGRYILNCYLLDDKKMK